MVSKMRDTKKNRENKIAGMFEINCCEHLAAVCLIEHFEHLQSLTI